jgi:GAF domain-containing protein
MNKDAIWAQIALRGDWETILESRRLAEDARRWLAAFQQRTAGSLNLAAMLDRLMKRTGADFGNVQLLDPRTGALTIVVQRGFTDEFLEFFSDVRENQAACGTARALGRRVVIEDVQADPVFAAADLQKIMTRAHVRAVQSTPLIGRNNDFLGMLSTHFRATHHPQQFELAMIDVFARQASHFIEYHRVGVGRERI